MALKNDFLSVSAPLREKSISFMLNSCIILLISWSLSFEALPQRMPFFAVSLYLKYRYGMNQKRVSYEEGLSFLPTLAAEGGTRSRLRSGEDQELIILPSLQPFSVCFKLAPRVRSILAEMVGRGAPINTVVGYHVIKSRGHVDGNGNRTEFSNHSFGTAIDINPELNGLYDNCINFAPACRLIRGGEWRPGVWGTIEKSSDIVFLFEQAGFKWGGEIAGKQKDFMHFSLTGY
jgi:hypothetical protein